MSPFFKHDMQSHHCNGHAGEIYSLRRLLPHRSGKVIFAFPLLCLLTGNCFSFREVYGLYSSGGYDVTCLPHPVNAWQAFGDAVQAVNDWTSPARNYLRKKRCDIAFRSCKSVIWKDFTHFSWGLGRRHLKQLITI